MYGHSNHMQSPAGPFSLEIFSCAAKAPVTKRNVNISEFPLKER